MSEKLVAGVTISDGTNVLGNVLGWQNDISVNEENVSGLSDTVGSPPIIKNKFLPVDVGETLSMNGIVYTGTGTGNGPDSVPDEALKTAGSAGTILTLELRYQDGSGYDYTGFFTAYNQTGDKAGSTLKYSGTFRVNDKTDVALP